MSKTPTTQARKQEGAPISASEILDNARTLASQIREKDLAPAYDDSPVLWHEQAEPPPYEMDRFVPGTRPGVRIPSLYLEDGEALFDRLSKGVSLLRFGDVDAEPLLEAAQALKVPLELIDLRDEKARRLYERDLILVRPDQHVVWRGDHCPADPITILNRIRGAG